MNYICILYGSEETSLCLTRGTISQVFLCESIYNPYLILSAGPGTSCCLVPVSQCASQARKHRDADTAEHPGRSLLVRNSYFPQLCGVFLPGLESPFTICTLVRVYSNSFYRTSNAHKVFQTNKCKTCNCLGFGLLDVHQITDHNWMSFSNEHTAFSFLFAHSPCYLYSFEKSGKIFKDS